MGVNFVEVRFLKVSKVDLYGTPEMVILKVVVGVALELVCNVLPDCWWVSSLKVNPTSKGNLRVALDGR